MRTKINNNKTAFTVLEMILTISIIGILLGGILIVVNSTNRLQKQRNNQRRLDVQEIISVILKYRSLEGSYPAGITDQYQEICDDKAIDCSGYLDLSLLKSEYFESIPEDPLDEDEIDGTGYRLRILDNKIWVDVINPELDISIEVSGWLSFCF